MLIRNKMPNAIGDIIPTIFVSDTCSIVVNNNPKTAIKRITPALIINPNMIGSLLFFSFPDIWFERYARNAGYRGNTHTAVSGVNNPSVNEKKRSVKNEIKGMISTPPLTQLQVHLNFLILYREVLLIRLHK